MDREPRFAGFTSEACVSAATASIDQSRSATPAAITEPMSYLILKAALSGIIVMIVSEAARRSPSVGGLIASLPLVSILGIM